MAGTDPGGLARGVRVALDVGSVRIGVAASDPDGILATPVVTVAAADEAAAVAEVAALVAERGVAVVYVGLPRHLAGHEGSASAAARTYGGLVARAVAPVPVRLVDERLSTVVAHRALRASGRPGRRQRAVVDQAAAVAILQGALDAERSTGRRAGEPCEPSGQATTDDGRGTAGMEVS